jgi:hypothetical protein
MDAIIPLLNNALTRRAVRTYEQYNLSHDMTSFYKGHLFQTNIKPQPESRLLILPPEIRHIIYEYVFTPSQATKSSDIVAVLATCRLVNQEAVNMALQRVHWRIITDSALVYRKGLWNLGNLQHHLRHIDIEMPLAKIDPVGANNPFLLSQLRLDHLQITFTDIENLEDWHDEVELYHKLISALMYRELSGKFSGEYVPTTEVYRSRQLSAKRQSELTMWNFQPTSTQLVHVMLNLQAKELVVKRKSNQEDILWKYFGVLLSISVWSMDLRSRLKTSWTNPELAVTWKLSSFPSLSLMRVARASSEWLAQILSSNGPRGPFIEMGEIEWAYR